MRKIIVFVFITSIGISYQSFSQSEIQSNDSEKLLVEWINHKIDSVVQKNNIPALSIGIIKNGHIIIEKGVGVLNRNHKQPATKHSMYQIASDTKKMTGAIVKNLVNEKTLELDKPIIHYLGDRIENQAKERLKNITLKHLLLHTSGLPYRQPTMTREDGEPMLKPYTEKLLLQDLNMVTLKSEPGAEFGYSNFGYAIAGYIGELASKKTYAELVQVYISKKYDMINTTIVLNSEQQKNLATPYRKEDRNKETSAFNMGKLSPAGGVYSTIHDLLKLMMLQMKVYANTNKNEQSNPLMLHENPTDKINGYGFGLGKKVFDSGIQYGHGGDMDGFASGYVFSPQYKSGVIILTSSGGRWVGQLEKEIFAKLTNQKYIPPKKSIALAFYNMILDTNLGTAKKWFEEHKTSNTYYLKEEEMNNVGYALLQQNKLNDALEVFNYNVELFPESANVYDSLGECYLKMNNTELALKNYKKSILINPENSNAKQVIEKIELEHKN